MSRKRYLDRSGATCKTVSLSSFLHSESETASREEAVKDFDSGPLQKPALSFHAALASNRAELPASNLTVRPAYTKTQIRAAKLDREGATVLFDIEAPCFECSKMACLTFTMATSSTEVFQVLDICYFE